MSLSTKLAASFTKNVRKRGDDYYCRGRVMVQEGSQSELTACVRGSGLYEVQFAWRDDRLAAWCDCPHFVEQGVPCKHVWAAILAADEHQYLTAAASADKLILDLDALGTDGLDAGDYLDGDEELYEEDGMAPLLSSRSPAVVRNPAKLGPPGWRKQLGEVFPPRDGTLAVQAGDPVCRGCREKRARQRFGSLTAIVQAKCQRQFLATQSSFHEPRPDRPAPAVRGS